MTTTSAFGSEISGMNQEEVKAGGQPKGFEPLYYGAQKVEDIVIELTHVFAFKPKVEELGDGGDLDPIYVCPKRKNLYQLKDLTELEVIELFACAQSVKKKVFQNHPNVVYALHDKTQLAMIVRPRDSMMMSQMSNQVHGI